MEMVTLSVVIMDCPMAQCASVTFAPRTIKKSEISDASCASNVTQWHKIHNNLELKGNKT